MKTKWTCGCGNVHHLEPGTKEYTCRFCGHEMGKEAPAPVKAEAEEIVGQSPLPAAVEKNGTEAEPETPEAEPEAHEAQPEAHEAEPETPAEEATH